MKLVVVTGCLGFIGMHVTRACLKKGWRVYGIILATFSTCAMVSTYQNLRL